jgi:carbonic anhydrase
MKLVHLLLLTASLLPWSANAFANETAHPDEHSDPHSASHTAESPSVTPLDALNLLKEGNRRFSEGEPSHAHQGAQRRRELASGQKPSAIILSCADSRVPPELVFDQGLGELFTIRVAGNVLGAATVASIEYAIEHLGSRLIVVMGHESCGAVKAALSTGRGKSAGSADLDVLVSMIQPAIETSEGRMPASALEDKTLRKPVMQNVNWVADRLVSRSRLIRKKVEAGQVQIVRAIYGMESGQVDFWLNP